MKNIFSKKILSLLTVIAVTASLITPVGADPLTEAETDAAANTQAIINEDNGEAGSEILPVDNGNGENTAVPEDAQAAADNAEQPEKDENSGEVNGEQGDVPEEPAAGEEVLLEEEPVPEVPAEEAPVEETKPAEAPALITEQALLEEANWRQTTDIADGVYIIRSAIDENFVFHIQSGLMTNGAAMQLYKYNESETQFFRFVKNEDKTYTITSFCCDKSIDVVGGSRSNGAKLQIYTPNGTGAQKWRLFDNGDGTISIMNAVSKKVIDVPGGKAANNVKLNMYTSNKTKAQKFVLEKVASPKHRYNGKFMIRSAIKNNFVFDIKGGSTANGGNLQLYTGNGSNAQWYNIAYVADGYYKITNVKSKKVVDISGARTAAGTNVQQYAWNKSAAQLWRIQTNGDGTVTFRSKLSDTKVLNVSGWKAVNGANITINTYSGVAGQKFKLDTKGITPVATTGKKGTQATIYKGLSEAKVVSMIGPLFTADQKKSGILACVSCAQFILESGYASTDLAQNANNCFGMKTNLSGNTWPGSTWDGKSKYTKKTGEQRADGTVYYITADFRKYPCIEDSIADHSAYLLGAKNGSKLRYAGLKGEKDYKKAITIIKKGGYATDTQYIQKICNIIERFNLTKYNA